MALFGRTNDKSKAANDVESARGQVEDVSEEEGADHSVQYEEGFTVKVMIGILFVCLVMLPGSIYLGLVAGQSLGAASQWVTIVLFSEIARRSFVPLKKQEIYCLFYMSGALVGSGFMSLPGISGGPFGSLIGLQFLMQSPTMRTVAEHLPSWIAPHIGSSAYIHRSLLDKAWYVPFLSPIPILLMCQVFDRMKWMGLGYLLFRITSDVERLPFPMGAVAASGATALAEASTKEESWRWRIFSTGTVLGLVFGFVYLGIPIISGVLFSKPLELLPIPFFDFTVNSERVLPTSLIGYNPDLGLVLLGFVLPYQICLGGVISSIGAQVFANPILHHFGYLTHWVAGSPSIQTKVANDFDFWMSFGIGMQFAVALIGFVSVAIITTTIRSKEPQMRRGSLAKINKQRGDYPWQWALAVWLLATIGYIALNHKLVPNFPFWIIVFYGLIWTPLNSYVTARMIALTGQGFDFPFLNQIVVLSSHYQQPDIWFAPLPLNNYGGQTQKFRELELTGTKFSSVVKMEVFMLPVILIFSFIYWAFLWHTNDIPSSQFPFVQKYWPQSAVTTSIWTQINSAGTQSAWVKDVIKPPVIATGGLCTLLLYGITKAFNLPLLSFYGLVGGVTLYPHNSIPTFLGAALGRFYFAKKFGAERWMLYVPVLLAGFSCGVGLMGMCAIAIALISKTVTFLPF